MSELRALILSGGESRRMGTDKGAMVFPGHDGKSQREYLQALFKCLKLPSFHSARPAQVLDGIEEAQIIRDQDSDSQGPAAGIVQAHRKFPEAAWLVLACDVLHPEAGLQELLKYRDPQQAATAFKNEDGFYEPLFAIWEPTALKALNEAWKQNEKSPQRVLQALKIKTLTAQPGWLKSANTPEEITDED